MSGVAAPVGEVRTDVNVTFRLPRKSSNLENGWVHTRRSATWILLACSVAAGAAACSSSPTSSSALPTVGSTTNVGSGSGSQASTEQQIAADWQKFFDSKTPLAERVGLLQDGPTFQAIIQSQEGSALESEASASVTQVALTSSTQARVNYSILLDGQPALPDQHGVAVFEGGVWKVGVGSFCDLLVLENGGKSSGLPTVCSTPAG